MRPTPDVDAEPPRGLLGLYATALPQVFGYLLPRCDHRATAEDLTAETFLAAALAERRDPSVPLSTAYLIGIARHKLIDHWRRLEREHNALRLAYAEPAASHDPTDAGLDAVHAHQVLGRLGAHHRAALTLRYLDGLPVAEVARLLGRTTHATEALLVRAKAAFRRLDDSGGGPA